MTLTISIRNPLRDYIDKVSSQKIVLPCKSVQTHKVNIKTPRFSDKKIRTKITSEFKPKT